MRTTGRAKGREQTTTGKQQSKTQVRHTLKCSLRYQKHAQ